jgi:hypothetical protein
MSAETHKHLVTGRYWFTSPEYPEPQVLWYCGSTNTVEILGVNNSRPLDATIRIIGPCQFVTVIVTERCGEQECFVGASHVAPPVVRQRQQVPFYDIDIDLGDSKIRFVSAAKTYEKRRGYEESTEFDIMNMSNGSVVIHPRLETKTIRRVAIGESP